jgi:hypothetical protein
VYDPVNGGDNIFTGGGSKDISGIQEGPWLSTSGKPQGKDDIENAFAALYKAPNGDDILYTGATRFDNSGNSTMGFWFFANAVSSTAGKNVPFTGTHTNGDLLIIANFTQGGSVSTPAIYQWVGDDATGHLSGPLANVPAGAADAVVNSSSITLPWTFTNKAGVGGNTALQGEFLEIGINLTGLGLNPCFASFLAETRSSQSPSATLSDFVVGSFPTCELDLPNTAHLSATNPAISVDSNQATITVTDDGMPMLAASTGSASAPRGLTDQQLQAVKAQAIDQWRAAGVDPQRLAALERQVVQVADLNHGELGWTLGNRTWIDRTAEGWGWSLAGSPDQGQMDLLTVVTHELGHVLGMPQTATGVMELTLTPGVRLYPGSGPTGEAPATMTGLAAEPSTFVSEAMSGPTVTTSAFTVLDRASALAPLASSLVTPVSPSTGRADIAAARAGSPAAILGTEGRFPPIPLSAEGPTLQGALHSGSQLPASYAVGPRSEVAAAIDRLFGPSDVLLDDAGALPLDGLDGLLDVSGAFPPASGDGTLGGQAIDRLFGGDRATLSDRGIDRLFGGEDRFLSDEEAGIDVGGIGTAAVVLGAGLFMGDRRHDREERSRLQTIRI